MKVAAAGRTQRPREGGLFRRKAGLWPSGRDAGVEHLLPKQVHEAPFHFSRRQAENDLFESRPVGTFSHLPHLVGMRAEREISRSPWSLS